MVSFIVPGEPVPFARADLVARGGGNGDENLTTSCKRCNQSKGALTIEEWLKDSIR
jgi:5-methylcytosine-specific restriction endonuclease McrA